MTVPQQPKIYHIVHIDRLASIITAECLWCDAKMVNYKSNATSIGMNKIKQRRLNELLLKSHSELYVGDCVPFYFCPRSIMLYIINQANNPDLQYRGGQGPIIHLESDLFSAIEWANQNNRKWAFTLSNAGAYYFEDRNNVDLLHEIDWEAVNTNKWSGEGISKSLGEGKQAEFLMQSSFPWHLVERIGVHSQAIYQQVMNTLLDIVHRPRVEVTPMWYY